MAVASPPVRVTNRYAALQTTDDDERTDDSRYEEPRSARRSAKRRRQLSQLQLQQQQQQQQLSSTVSSDRRQNQQQGGSQRAPRRAMIGMAPSTSNRGLVAAKKIVRKAVFCIGNVASNCQADDVRRFVENLSVHVFTCFPVASRRRRVDDGDDDQSAVSDRQAFRLCIAADDRERLLDASKWPESVLIRPWFRIRPAVAAERRTVCLLYTSPSPRD